MKLLMARVGEKVKGLQGTDQVHSDKHEVVLDSREKLAALLEGKPASG